MCHRLLAVLQHFEALDAGVLYARLGQLLTSRSWFKSYLPLLLSVGSTPLFAADAVAGRLVAVPLDQLQAAWAAKCIAAKQLAGSSGSSSSSGGHWEDGVGYVGFKEASKFAGVPEGLPVSGVLHECSGALGQQAVLRLVLGLELGPDRELRLMLQGPLPGLHCSIPLDKLVDVTSLDDLSNPAVRGMGSAGRGWAAARHPVQPRVLEPNRTAYVENLHPRTKVVAALIVGCTLAQQTAQGMHTVLLQTCLSCWSSCGPPCPGVHVSIPRVPFLCCHSACRCCCCCCTSWCCCCCLCACCAAAGVA